MQGTKREVLRWLIDAPDRNAKGEEKQYEVKEWHEKRHLTQNAYYHVLKGQLAQVLHTSTDELHEILLRRYGVVIGTTITTKADVPVTMLPGHWMPWKGNGEWQSYIRIKGSSDMDTKEFSALLDGLISECHEVGISTMTPTELAKLKDYMPKEMRDAQEDQDHDDPARGEGSGLAKR